MPRAALLIAIIATATTLAACGTNEAKDPTTPATPQSAELRRQLDEATRSTAADFPPTSGKTLQQVADNFDGTGPQVGLATSIFTPGTNRLAFGVIDEKTGFVYGQTAVYIARGPNARAMGPYPAPADLLLTDGPFRSQTAASEGDPFAAVYSATVNFPGPGRYAVLVATKFKGQVIGAPTQVNVIPKAKDPVAAVGTKAPRVDTDTLESAGGNIKAIDTRLPPDDMHTTNLRDVLGKKPAILLFATPQLCQSRVCGPVVDIAAQLESTYKDKAAFIHQEVYVDNDTQKGLRKPLQQFGLPTEPWLFAIDRNGIIVDRLEGSFGFNAFNAAVKKAIAD